MIMTTSGGRMTCPGCASENPDNKSFCGECGRALKGASDTTLAPMEEREKEPTSPRWFQTPGGLICFGLLGVIVGWLIYRDRADKSGVVAILCGLVFVGMGINKLAQK